MSFLDAALGYQEQKYSVIPIVPKGKKPVVEKWKNFQNQLATKRQITEWWGKWPDANVGIVTGAISGLVVIDCDSEEAIARILETYPDATNTLQVQTGKGTHFYFKWEAEIRNYSGTILGPEIDIKSDGGLIVAPPSIHANGECYKWLTETEPAPLPDELKKVLTSAPKIMTQPTDVDKPVAGVDLITEGTRNNFLTSKAGGMRRPGLSQESILEKLKELNTDHCDPPLEESEVEKIAKSVGRYDPAEGSHAEKKSADNPWELALDVSSFLSQEDKEFKGLVKDLLAPESITIIASPRGLGKTMVSYALAVALANGGIFRDEQIDPPRRVLLLDRDNPTKVIKKRLRSWQANQSENLRVLTREDCPGLKDKKAWEAFPAELYDVVIIDSLGSFTEGITEKEGKQTTEVLATILDLARRGPAVLLLQNTTKDGANTRGRGEWADRADIIYEVRDATGLVPSGKKAWWQELPEAGEKMWAERAARRAGQTVFRLAFTASKFRLGPEPQPFCLEINLPPDEAWTLRDVTADLVKSGEDVMAQSKKAKEEERENAANALVEEIGKREPENPMLKSEAVEFLHEEQDLTQTAARSLVTTKTGTLWKEENLQGGRGKGRPIALLLCGQGIQSIIATD